MRTRYQLEEFGRDHPAPAQLLAELHSELLPDSPLTLLGREFMSSFYYQEMPRDDLIFGFVSYVDGHAAGFISLTADSDNFMKIGLRRKWLQFIAQVTRALLRKPTRIRALLEANSIARDRSQNDAQSACGEILSFGVRSAFRGRSFAARTGLRLADDLFTKALAEFERRGLRRARGIVDQDNIAIQRFHDKHGLRLLSVQPHGWRTPSYEYEWINPSYRSNDD